MRYLRKIRGVFSLAILLALVLSCAKDRYFETDSSVPANSQYTPATKSRTVPQINRNVMIMISGGRNSLSSYLTQDLAELEASDGIPSGAYASNHALVVFSRLGSNKTAEAPAALYKVYKGRNGDVIRDTLRTWGGFVQMFGENTLKEALETVVQEFPGSNYGIVLSSHATGYLPEGYYKDPSAYEEAHRSTYGSTLSVRGGRSLALEEFPPIPEYPRVKSVGQDDDYFGSVEMDMRKFRDALPCHMDYILFDACLMAGVEVAYELKDKASIIGFSPTEILADGFDYKLIASRLVSDTPDPVQVCRDYFEQYKILPEGSDTRCATISAVDTRYLDELAAVCKTLFGKYHYAMSSVNPDTIQRYYRSGRHFFYDLRDILSKSGASEEDLQEFDSAMEKVVVYKDHTPTFLGIQIGDTSYSGLSMYLPRMGSSVLDVFYRENVAWNAATELVK